MNTSERSGLGVVIVVVSRRELDAARDYVTNFNNIRNGCCKDGRNSKCTRPI